MIRLSEPRRRDVPGETNFAEHLPRGVAVVIPPWNFPLAIPTGMTVAALVAGNAVILKPSEQAPVMAWHLSQAIREAGLPPGVLNYLPGLGEEVGQALVNHPGVDLIAFTGSREVGLLINRQAADTKPGQDHIKRVIAEMGGKNAIIVDDDADLDEAVVGVIQSRLRLRRSEVLGLLAGDRALGNLRRLRDSTGRGRSGGQSRAGR